MDENSSYKRIQKGRAKGAKNRAKKDRGLKINIWGGISYCGKVSLIIFEENMNA